MSDEAIEKVLKWTRTTEDEWHTELMRACQVSTDPEVRRCHSFYMATLLFQSAIKEARKEDDNG